ncbi:MAG: putative serine protease PepD [Streptomyces sp.]|jgi:putative serine protease PepD|nr:putative serine protease PepD [Streptomyces sp.]
MNEDTPRSSSASDPQQPYGSGGYDSSGTAGGDAPYEYASASSGADAPSAFPPPPSYDPAQPVTAAPGMTVWPGSPVPPDPAAPAHKARRSRRPIALIAAVALVSALIGGGSAALIARATTTSAAGTTTTKVINASSSSSGVAAVAKADSPSIVEITATSGSSEATGSGVIITSDGEIITNNHVISGATTIKITFSNGKTATAKVVGTDKNKDLALIKAENVSGLTAAALGDSSNVAVGDQVVAIGSPEGLTGTVTSGIISALNRDVTVSTDDSQSGSGSSGQGGGRWPFSSGGQNYNGSTGSNTTTYKALQTDAAVNPGNSGGALINMNGEIIGINSAMYSASSSSSSSSAGSIGLGFAIPINTVKSDLASLRSGGTS